MTELKPKPSGGRGYSVNFRPRDAESGFLEALCLTTPGESELALRRERPAKLKPAQHSIEIVKQLIEFIQAL
jgi:hypothetical protein